MDGGGHFNFNISMKATIVCENLPRQSENLSDPFTYSSSVNNNKILPLPRCNSCTEDRAQEVTKTHRERGEGEGGTQKLKANISCVQHEDSYIQYQTSCRP